MVPILKIFILSILSSHSVIANITWHESIIANDITNCLIQLIEDNFEEPGDINFGNADNDNILLSMIKLDILKKISSKLKYRTLTTTFKKEKYENEPYCNNILRITNNIIVPSVKYYFIITENTKDLSDVIKEMICALTWNANARFIILLLDFSHQDIVKEKIENVFTFLYQNNVFNVAIVVPQVEEIRYLSVYSWKPLDPPKYCGYFNESATNRLVVKSVCVHGIVKKHRNIFQNSIPSDMKGCVLKVLALEKHPFASENEKLPNIEIKLINSIIKRFNFKMDRKIIHGYRGERDANGEWNGALSFLSSKQGHILFGGIFPDYDVHQDFECSTVYLFDTYTWVVPRGDFLPPWQALTLSFKQSLWYCFGAGFILSVFTWRILGKLCNDSAYNQNLSHCFLNAWMTTIGLCNYSRPLKNSLRVFWVSLNVHSLLLIAAYQAKLIIVLRHPSFENEIKETKELVTSGLGVGGSEQLHDLFINSSDPIDRALGDRWINVDNMPKALIDVAKHRNFSVLCSRMELAHFSTYIPGLRDAYGTEQYYAFKESIFTVPIEIIASKGFAFMPSLSKTLDKFKQSGELAAMRRLLVNFVISDRDRVRQKRNSKFKVLTMKHLRGGFLVLVIGHVTGVVVLCLEALFFFFRRYSK